MKRFLRNAPQEKRLLATNFLSIGSFSSLRTAFSDETGASSLNGHTTINDEVLLFNDEYLVANSCYCDETNTPSLIVWEQKSMTLKKNAFNDDN